MIEHFPTFEAHSLIDSAEPIDYSKISPFQRVLLVADGTLTYLIEAYLEEQISVVKLNEFLFESENPLPELELTEPSSILSREILLKGDSSQRHWLYAYSFIILDRVDPCFHTDLVQSHIPIGKLWRQHRVETYKEMISCVRHPAFHLAPYFNITPQDELLSRTYRVFVKGRPVMLITEKLSIHSFL